MPLSIRQYTQTDEDTWVECHLQSYYNSIYIDELVKVKPRYENPAIELVALEGNKIVGVLDVEIEAYPGHFCLDDSIQSGMISIIGVMPQYRKRGVATNLIEMSSKVLKDSYDIRRLEIWIRDDPELNVCLQKIGFHQIHHYFQVTLAADFFEKHNIVLPGITPILLTGSVDSTSFSKLIRNHPPERTYKILVLEKTF
ncbi:MAG: GNAT family N-acetyltransferase [Candidatus Heimdallarchaeota archaeon]|nr:MAG: GNAT family N-acetyltransferase [Candidatus Heimdallarchaeota archaeon]